MLIQYYLPISGYQNFGLLPTVYANADYRRRKESFSDIPSALLMDGKLWPFFESSWKK